MTDSNFALKLLYLALILTSVSCDNRKIVQSGFNDLVFGSQSFILYDDNTFYIEMGAGGLEGNYQINHDTVKLKYFDKLDTNWPDMMLIRKDYFISSDSLDNTKYLKISRDR